MVQAAERGDRLRNLEDRAARRAVREAVALVKHLRERDGVREQLIDLERTDRAELQVEVPADGDVRHAMAAAGGESADTAIRRYLARQANRKAELFRVAAERSA